MSTIENTRPAVDGLAMRQFAGIFRIELRRSLLSRRSAGLYFLMLAPVALLAVIVSFMAAFGAEVESGTIMEIGPVFASTYVLYITVALFLGAMLMFNSLFRSELMDKSLHYYFLTSARREVLVVAKYSAALAATWLTAGLGTLGLYVFFHLTFGASALFSHVFQGPGLGHVFAYLATTMFVVAAYGAVFLLTGLYFRNPLIPTILIWFWERANHYVPAVLKPISVAFYLPSFYPVPPAGGQVFGTVTSPPSAWLAVPGLVIFTVVVLFLSALRAREMELTYTDD